MILLKFILGIKLIFQKLRSIIEKSAKSMFYCTTNPPRDFPYKTSQLIFTTFLNAIIKSRRFYIIAFKLIGTDSCSL